MESRKTISSFSKTSSGRTDFDNINTPTANLSYAKSDYVSYNKADLSGVNFYRAELCEFHGTKLNKAKFNQAVLICSSFSNETILSDETNHADVNGCLLLLSTCD